MPAFSGLFIRRNMSKPPDPNFFLEKVRKRWKEEQGYGEETGGKGGERNRRNVMWNEYKYWKVKGIEGKIEKGSERNWRMGEWEMKGTEGMNVKGGIEKGIIETEKKK